MQLFSVSVGVPSVSERSLTESLRAAGSPFPRFDEGPVWSATSASGNVVVAALHHPEELVGPRSYRARVDDVVVAYDGLPVHRSGRWNGHDAHALLANWADVPHELEGQFAALRVDLRSDDVALVTDSFGIAPLYHATYQGGHIVANSVEALRRLTDAGTPSPLGVSSFASTGWAAGDTTLISGVRALPGGSEYRLSRTGLHRRRHLTPASVAATARSGRRISTDTVLTDMVELTAALAAAGLPIQCGLTAGRDTRLQLALLMAADADDVHYYTGGHDGEPDVEGARLVARELGLPHEVRPVDVLDDAVEWKSLTKMLVSQTDGLSSLIQIGDYHDQLSAPSQLGVKTVGLGGEFGRCGVRLIPYATNFPLFLFSTRIQERLLMERAREYSPLWTADAMNEVEEFVRVFLRERRREGWKVRELSEAHYAFDRVARWGSTSVRRTAGTHDFFSPYCSRAFMDYCASLTSEERYIEASHYRLLSALSPRLRDIPFGKPWKEQKPRRVPLQATSDLAQVALKRYRRYIPGTRPSSPAPPRYSMRWFNAHAGDHMEMCLSVADSPLWAWVDRSAVERAFRAEPMTPARMGEGLVRVATLFWYFHGRDMD
jgi:asparagine synthase (glutamine-hydrolysing)